jgi:hypothetical protein
MENIEAKYGELAREFGEKEFNPERIEEHEKLRQIARNILDCFDWNPNKEDFLVVTDTKVIRENPLMVKALEWELKKQSKDTKGRYKNIVTAESPKSATPLGVEIGEQMHDKPVLILTSMSRSHSRETGTAMRGDLRFSKKQLERVLGSEGLKKMVEAGYSTFTPEILEAWQGRISDDVWQRWENLAKSKRSRIISITKGHNPYEILTKGAVFENVEKLRERADKVEKLMRDVRRVHVTTPLGTDLWLAINPKFFVKEDGRINEPGKLANYPIGECAFSPDWRGSDGILVVDGPCGGNINQHILDKGKPLRLTIKDGEVISAEGGEEALKLWRAYLDSGNNKQNHAYKLAELGIGINSRALEDKPREYWGSTEGEKKYGTVHIAVGSNGTFGRTPDDPSFNAAEVHCDIITGLNHGGEVTVECEKKDGSNFLLIDKGKPVGY